MLLEELSKEVSELNGRVRTLTEIIESFLENKIIMNNSEYQLIKKACNMIESEDKIM